jgi:hypothetical protein
MRERRFPSFHYTGVAAGKIRNNSGNGCRFRWAPGVVLAEDPDVRSLPPNFKRRTTMRFMIMIKATAETEAGEMPSEQLLTEMGNFNEQLVKAGIMLGGEGLHPTRKGARVRFSGDKRSVVDGPFAESKELIAGYWLWQCKSIDEAIEWVKRCPNPTGAESEIEIRQVFEMDDFGAEFTPELREQEKRVWAEASQLANKTP